MSHVSSFDPAFLTDPAAFAIGRLPAHSDHHSYRVGEETQAGHLVEYCLDGLWKYHHAQNLNEAPSEFAEPDCDISAWEDLPVPAHVQLHGYDRPQYVNIQYPWDGHEDLDPPQIPTRYNPVSTYIRDLNLEAPQAGERIHLVFDGAESALALWVNGSFIGYATDSFTPSEFDVTEALRPGHNRIAVRVWKWSAGSWLEDQDFYRFSGLFRSVWLRRIPPVHIRDLHIATNLDPDYSRAQVDLHLDISGSAAKDATIRATIDGVGELQPDGDGKWTLTIDHPKLWSAETPNLYTLHCEILSPGGDIYDVVNQPFGVRRCAIDNGVLTINGQRLVLRGVNRHEFGLRGRVVTAEETERDIIALKKAGFNALRTSHYPNSSILYDLCDRYGLYVIDEMNLETHGMWERIIRGAPESVALPGDQQEWKPAIQDRAASMMYRDRNHPSIIMWSLGNESYGGTVLRDIATWLRDNDDRPIHYEGVHWDPRYPETTDVISQMYTSAEDVAAYLDAHPDKPMILCEFAHAMGNSCGAVEKYMDLIRANERFQGVFVWDFADQAIALRDRWGKEYFGYGGDCQEAPHDGDFSGNGLFFADHTPTPKLAALSHLYQGIHADITRDNITIRNEYAFLNTSAFNCQVTLKKEGKVLATTTLETAVAPGEKAVIPQPLDIPPRPGEYTLDMTFALKEATLWAGVGHCIARNQAVVTNDPAPQWARIGAGPALVHYSPLRIAKGTHSLGIGGDHFHCLFSRLRGGMQSYRIGNGARAKEMLRAVPTVNFWHAPTANERGWGAPAEDGQWLLASRYAHIKESDPYTIEQSEDSLSVSWTVHLPSNPSGTCDITAQIFPDSTVDFSLTLNPDQALPAPPEFGMLFALDPDLTCLKWYGEGPQESAIDRRAGAFLDIYEGDVTTQLTPYIRPQESGSHTGVRWASVTNQQGVGLHFAANTPMEFSALPHSPFEIENAAHPVDLPPHQYTWVRPTLMRRGVAGDNSWGARTHPEFCLPTGPLSFSFSMRATTAH
ncbi:MAG: glycoside hydrolase family 2 TIM barrel-domain containing protein [Actinomycetaceae bacterium]|nr:glycoside hydrolase family 2 TIM barrel-domain containing protein [Actinomycetaceae bacterium]